MNHGDAASAAKQGKSKSLHVSIQAPAQPMAKAGSMLGFDPRRKPQPLLATSPKAGTVSKPPTLKPAGLSSLLPANPNSPSLKELGSQQFSVHQTVPGVSMRETMPAPLENIGRFLVGSGIDSPGGASTGSVASSLASLVGLPTTRRYDASIPAPAPTVTDDTPRAEAGGDGESPPQRRGSVIDDSAPGTPADGLRRRLVGDGEDGDREGVGGDSEAAITEGLGDVEAPESDPHSSSPPAARRVVVVVAGGDAGDGAAGERDNASVQSGGSLNNLRYACLEMHPPLYIQACQPFSSPTHRIRYACLDTPPWLDIQGRFT